MPIVLLSVSNKQGLLEFAQGLHNLGWQLLASGGTAAHLSGVGLPVWEVANYTASPEVLDGRVKTLHPRIHAGLLAQRTASHQADLDRLQAEYIDLLVVNLYPFAETVAAPHVSLEAALEQIDIGGVALLRAGAKNFTRVGVLTDPADYPLVLERLRLAGELDLETRQRLAVKAFAHTAAYDQAIHTYLDQLSPAAPAAQPDSAAPWELHLFPLYSLRYGENPHQTAQLYGFSPQTKPLGGDLLQGKPLSYNNILDLDAGWRAVVSFAEPTIVLIKHLSPCGIASADSLDAAFPLALAADPVSAFGGVLAANRVVDAQLVEGLGSLFLECIIAPGFTSEALARLSRKKNLRLVSMPGLQIEPDYELRSVVSGVLRQSRDVGDPQAEDSWRVVTHRQPTTAEWQALRFAWRACQHVKSNAIVFGRGQATVGIGGGQPNRVDCVRIAAARAGARAQGAVMASDAFFPFPDSVAEAARVGIRAIIQPGGSLRDEESIAAADAHEIAMIFTGVRHFRH